MLRSLFSGVSGLKNQQTKMDVIGNNIANANTTAFKASRVTFKDMLSQTYQNATASSADDSGASTGIGGTNPRQVGLGMAVAAIDTDMSQGALQPTGRATDLAVQDNGFFVVADKEGADGNFYYTRDGSFSLDSKGFLVTSEGYHVMGTLGTTSPVSVSDTKTDLNSIKIDLEKTDGTKLKSFSVDKDGTIRAIYTDTPEVIGRIALANFQNPAGLEKQGGNLYRNTNNSGDPKISGANEKGAGTIQQGFLEMSKVDLANEFTEMIITSRAYQANSKTITTSDEMLQQLMDLKR